MKVEPLKETKVEQPRVPSYEIILRCKSFPKADDKDSVMEEKKDEKTRCRGQLEKLTKQMLKKTETEKEEEEKEGKECLELRKQMSRLRLGLAEELVARSPTRTQQYQHCPKPYESRAYSGWTRAVQEEQTEGNLRSGYLEAGKVEVGVWEVAQWVTQCEQDPKHLQEFLNYIPQPSVISDHYNYKCCEVNGCSKVSSLFRSPAQSPSEQNLTSPESVTSEENSLYCKSPNIFPLNFKAVEENNENVCRPSMASADLSHLGFQNINGGTLETPPNIGTVMRRLAGDPLESAIDLEGWGGVGVAAGAGEGAGKCGQTEERDALNKKLDPRAKESAWTRISQVDLDLLGKGDSDGDTQLMILLVSEKEKIIEYVYVIVERLLKEKPEYLSLRNELNQDALYLAAFKLVREPLVASYIAEALVRGNQDVNMKYEDGNTLIHCLAKNGDSHAKILERLAKLRRADGNPVFDVNKKNNRGYTPLHIACEAHKPELLHTYLTVRVLVENGADPTAKDYKDENTPLHTLINESCDAELLRELLESVKKRWAGSGPLPTTVLNRQGNTALHLACARNTLPLLHQKDVITLLRKHGAMIQTKNINGCVPSVLIDGCRKQEIKSILHSYRQKY